MDYVAASTAAALLSEVPPPGCEVPVISDVYLQGVDGFFLYHNMFDAATLAAERVQAPDPEVPVVSHIYLHGVNEITTTGAALPSIVNLRGLGTVSTSTAAAPDPEVPVVNHV